jgi:hypothetical protein
MRYLVLGTVLLVLSGLVGGVRPTDDVVVQAAESVTVYTVNVYRAPLDPQLWGLTSSSEQRPHADVTINTTVPTIPAIRGVLVHELFHAVGLKGHPFGEACFTYYQGRLVPPAHLCPDELAWLRARNVVADVYVRTDAMAAVTKWSVDFLNKEVGRPMFRLVK